ncbi:carbonate dehydratase [gamma proteobacterium HTCC5015]|nr:carbonate dehydratase [gamma proteobacterium HTCC5015]
MPVMNAQKALEDLKEGNRRFVQAQENREDLCLSGMRRELPQTQEPKAIIVGCSDARVPAELVFDQGLGDLFVIRVAGNVVAPSQVGSVEFAAENFGTQLVVVLGHTHCGAIQATLEALKNPEQTASSNLMSIVDRIKPSVESLYESSILRQHPEELTKQSVRANIRASVNFLKRGSRCLEELVSDGRLLVVGAEYSLETGEVEFI